MELTDYIDIIAKAFFYMGVTYTALIMILFIGTRLANTERFDNMMRILGKVFIFIWILTMAAYIFLLIAGLRAIG